MRRCDVLVQNKTIHSLNLFTWSNISLKMATWAIGKILSCDTRARSLHYRFYRFNLVWPPVFVVDDLCQNIRNVFTITLVVNKSVILLAFWREIQLTDVCIITCSNLHTERFAKTESARWRASAWSDKMNKEINPLMIPPWIWFVKNMLNSTISMELPRCCNCMYRI